MNTALNDLIKSARNDAHAALTARDVEHEQKMANGYYGAVVDDSRWWMNISSLLEPLGRKFVEDASAIVTSPSLDGEDLKRSANDFFNYLGQEYARRYRSTHPDSDYLPPHWQEGRRRLEIRLEIALLTLRRAQVNQSR